MEKFTKLGIKESIIKTIQEEKFEKPSEIQEKSIPLILKGRDVIAGSATGSGKTLAFAAGIIQNVVHGQGVQSLVLTPTRELANQVAKSIRKFSKYNELNTTQIYGGVSIEPQIKELRRTDVVIGTPGRILDHVKRQTINLSRVKILVLDEADRMLDMGFIDDVKKIIDRCPIHRQTLLFSATISRDVVKLAERYMQNPIEISAESYVDPSKLSQIYYDVEDNMKFSLLVHLLKNEKAGLVMVFCNTQRNTDFVAKNLKSLGIDALAIHGGLSQNKRDNVMKQFHSQNVCVLVCTDIAARGLDIKGISHIYNYDIPRESKQYIHRIGRTARAGKEGMAISILASRDYDNFKFVLKEYPDFKILRKEIPEIERVTILWKEKSKRFENRYSGGTRRRNFSRSNSRGGDSRRQNFGNLRSRNFKRNNRFHKRRFSRRYNIFA